MISLDTAKKLKQAGLIWIPSLHDFFAVPERSLDDKLFVISDLLVTIEQLQGMQVVSFQGASEWALDYLVTADTVWMPREDQLRQALEAALLSEGTEEMELVSGLNGSCCTIVFGGERLAYRAPDASEAYSLALLHVLISKQEPGPGTGVVNGSIDPQGDKPPDEAVL